MKVWLNYSHSATSESRSMAIRLCTRTSICSSLSGRKRHREESKADPGGGFKVFRCAEAGLIRNIHGIDTVAGLDGDELGYLLGKVALQRSFSEAPKSAVRVSRVPD